MTLKDRLLYIKDKLFLTDTAYFLLMHTHSLVTTKNSDVPVYINNGALIFSEEFFENTSDIYLEDVVRAECLRIAMKHPYQRILPSKEAMYLSSNIILGNNGKYKELILPTTSTINALPGARSLGRTSAMEDIYNVLKPLVEKQKEAMCKEDKFSNDSTSANSSKRSEKSDGDSKSSSNPTSDADESGANKNSNNVPFGSGSDLCSTLEHASDITKYWGEDDYIVMQINDTIEKIENTCGWGDTPGHVVDIIKESMQPKFNYRSVFQNFRSTIISSARVLTRMKPNRRYGYSAMGSKREFTTKILVVVDTSGSISDKDLKYALGFIRGFFKYGIDRIDCVSFDTKVHDETLCEISKAKDTIKIAGRGGTDFNDIFAFVHERRHFYDGVIIYTDGYASEPDSKWRKYAGPFTKYIWCMCDKTHYDSAIKYGTAKKLEKFGKITYIEQ